jgi:hypothetical protein
MKAFSKMALAVARIAMFASCQSKQDVNKILEKMKQERN